MAIVNGRKLLIYFFYDRDGVVDDYIPYMLNDLNKNIDDIVVVCNGKLQEEGRKRLEQFTDRIILRENKGFDVWAYKTAMETIGWDELIKYDEVILMNFTIMGPLYPFSEMFDDMNKRDVDFWGITMFHRFEGDPFGTMEEGYIPDHIQSHFIAIRQPMLSSEEFRKYWEDMPMIVSYQDSVGTHEARFTKYFEKLGYKWQVYVDTQDLADITNNPVISVITRLIEEKRCPIFKRRSFMQQYDVVINETCGQEAALLFEYIKNNTDYDCNMILDNLLRLENQADLKKNFQWNYVLPKNYVKNKDSALNKKIALVMHIYFIDLIEGCKNFASSMPTWSDIYITTDTEEKRIAIEDSFKDIECNSFSVLVCENKGADVGPFLVEFGKIIDKYDYVCHAHDKKAGQNKPGTIGTSFAYRCFENLLCTREYVSNVLSVMDENPRIGLLTPPPPNHGDYYITLGLEWSNNYENTVALAKELGINVNMNQNKEPIAPLGGFFWARTSALKPLFSKKWEYDDFICSKGQADGTLAHAIERIYPFSVQAAGYYPAWIMSDMGAATEITNLNYMLHALNDVIFFKGQGAGRLLDVVQNIDKSYDISNRFNSVNSKLDFTVYYKTEISAYSESTAYKSECILNNGMYEFDINMNPTIMITGLRIDPGEMGMISIRQFELEIYDENDCVSRTVTLRDCITNGIRVDNEIVFLAADPQLGVSFIKPIGIKKIICRAQIEKKVTEESFNAIQMQCKKDGIIKKTVRKILGK